MRNGAGKTTAVRILATLMRPDGGHARVWGHDVVSHAHQVRQLIGLTRATATRCGRWSATGVTVLLTTRYLEEADVLAGQIAVVGRTEAQSSMAGAGTPARSARSDVTAGSGGRVSGPTVRSASPVMASGSRLVARIRRSAPDRELPRVGADVQRPSIATCTCTIVPGSG